jgi:hypothetical protein
MQVETRGLWCDRTEIRTGFGCESGPGSVVGIATGYGLDGPGIESLWGARISAPAQTGPGAHPAPCTMGTESFPWVKSSRDVTLTPHPLLVLWSWKGRAVPLLPLWAVRPVQTLSAWTRVHFTLPLGWENLMNRTLLKKPTRRWGGGILIVTVKARVSLRRNLYSVILCFLAVQLW